MTAHHIVEPAANGSRATLMIEMEGALGAFWGWATKGITAKYMALEAAGLKARSENPDFSAAQSPAR